ncbi:hypothetical protein IAU60_006205 [Kwoniella sp. DSM 27419]
MLDSPRLRSSPSLGPPNGHLPALSKRRESGLKARGTQLLALRFGWIVLVIWFEVGDFFHSLSTCRFPDSILRRSHPHIKDPPAHVVLLADTHVPHPVLSYPPDSRPWVNWIKQQMDELFMRKSWNVVMRLGRVDAVIVLGDMLDCGRGVMSDAEYEDYHGLFRSIFRLPEGTPMHFVPGNHDIPLGPNRLFSPQSRDRYAAHFSPPNTILPIANHSLIMLDAVGLVEEDYRRYAAEMQFGEWDGLEGGVIEFVKDLGDTPPTQPRILISHIPLARPEASTCGPLREKGRILKGAGPGYQNLLGSETSRFLLEALKPSVVFSGDDHDYCEYRHPTGGVKEVTIKSFSSSTGIRRPGFQLLSLVPPDPNSYSTALTHADRPCLLPDQLGVYYRVYIPLGILTILYLFGTNIRAAWQRWSAGRNSLYGDLKSRISPMMRDSETMPQAGSLSARRGVSDRPVPLTLPSRKSSQHLTGMGSTTATPGLGPRPLRYASNPSSEQLGSRNPSVSAPVSPFASPRMSFADDRERPGWSHHSSGLGRMDEDVEANGLYEPGYGYGSGSVAVSNTPSPSVSRRSSYIYMNDSHRGSAGGPGAANGHGYGHGHGHGVAETPDEASGGHGNGSYFLPLPGSTAASGAGPSGGAGLGFTTPQGSHFPFHSNQQPSLRRVSSSTFSLGSSANAPPAPLGGGGATGFGSAPGSQLISPAPVRRVTMPRVMSTSDWAAAASKKDKSLYEYMTGGAASAPRRSAGGSRVGLDHVKKFVVWLWRARNGVVAKSWKETLAVAWPAAVVWIIINALFFRS